MSNKNKIKEEDIDKALDEILNENISVESFQEMAARSLEDQEFEKVNQLLLEHYNSKNKTDFQEMLKTELGLRAKAKVVASIQGSNELEIEEDSKVEQDISSELGADKETMEEAEKQVEQKEEEEPSENKENEFDLRAELMKQVYIAEFKKYSDLVYNLKQAQINAHELTVGDSEGTKLVLYEKYLKNLEKNYMGYANSKNLEEKKLSDNDEIKNIKDDLSKSLDKNEEYNQNYINKKLQKIEELNEKRRNVAAKMNEITTQKDKKPEEYQRLMDEYQKEYREITYEIRQQDPSIETYVMQIQKEQENQEFAQRQIPLDYETDRIAGRKIDQSQKGKFDELDEVEYSAEEKVVKVTNLEDDKVAENLDDNIEQIGILIDQGQFQKAEELLQSTEGMLDVKVNQDKEATEQKSKDTNQKLNENLDKTQEGNKEQEKNDLNDERSYWKNSTVEKEDVEIKDDLKERLSAVSGTFREKYPNYNKNKEEMAKELAKQKQINS